MTDHTPNTEHHEWASSEVMADLRHDLDRDDALEETELERVKRELLLELDRVTRAMLAAQTWVATGAGSIRREDLDATSSTALIAHTFTGLQNECDVVRLAQLGVQFDALRAQGVS